MKGFKDKSGKFRPTENKHGVRKSRDQTAKSAGVKVEKKDWTYYKHGKKITDKDTQKKIKLFEDKQNKAMDNAKELEKKGLVTVHVKKDGTIWYDLTKKANKFEKDYEREHPKKPTTILGIPLRFFKRGQKG